MSGDCLSLHYVKQRKDDKMLKILLWVILIIFLIGLLVVTGVFKMIF